jgi:hypothetical protein
MIRGWHLILPLVECRYRTKELQSGWNTPVH